MLRMKYLLLAILVIALGSLAACNGDAEKAAADADAASATHEHDAEPAHEHAEGDGHDHQHTPPPPPAAPQELSGAHILVMYQGSQRAPATITRTKEEALELAKEIAQKARAGEDFAELAKEYSDGPSGPRGGELGIWTQGRMVPEFDQAILGMDIGGISDPVETDFGYHIITRKKVEKISARHILIMHEGSQRAPTTITRTREEALARAEEVKQKLDDGADFEAMAKEYSDGPTRTRGGDLNSFGRSVMHPDFEKAAFALEVGGISDPVETPFGYHIIQRYQ